MRDFLVSVHVVFHYLQALQLLSWNCKSLAIRCLPCMTTSALRKPQRAATESSWKATACRLPTGPGPALRHRGPVVLHGKGWTGAGREHCQEGVTLCDPAVCPAGWLNTLTSTFGSFHPL